MTQVEADTLESTSPEPAPAAPRSLYRYSMWVHVGHGAEDCTEVDEETGICTCSDTSHFHAWCRLPNAFQEREIRDFALAAKARKVRQLRTAGSDANEILESSLEEILAQPDSKKIFVDELIGYDWSRDFVVAVREVRDLDDDGEGAEDGAKLFDHIDQDQARFSRLALEDPDKRSEDEFTELQQHIDSYQNKVQEHYDAIVNPKRASFDGMDELDLSNLLRLKRVETAAMDEFMHHYSAHEILSCSYVQQAADAAPRFRDLDHLKVAASEVLDVLHATFADLERSNRSAEGN